MNRREKYLQLFKDRIHEIDLLRGFLIILVVFDHLMWFFLNYIFQYNHPFLLWYWTSDLRYIVRQFVIFLFMFLCGISCHLSKNNKKRGVYLLIFSIIVSIGSYILQLLPMFANRVVHLDINILGVIAISILAYSLVEKRSNRDVLYITAVLMIFYFFILISSRTLPNTEFNHFLSILYCPFNPIKEGYVADYLPLFPYIIFLFLGVLFARIIYKNKTSVIARKGNWERPICFLGRHTLLIYVAHEIIFTLVFMGISVLMKL